MADAREFKDVLSRLLRARIPLITIRSIERGRVLEILKAIAREINLPVGVHTLSEGVRDLATGRAIAENERTVHGALEVMGDRLRQAQQLTFVLTEPPEVGDDTPDARAFLDLVMLAGQRNGTLVVVTNKPVWPTLQRQGMAIALDPPGEDEMLEILRELVEPYRGELRIEWQDAEFRTAAQILAGITQAEAENVVNTLLVDGTLRADDLEKLSQAKDRMFSDLAGIERVPVRAEEVNIGGLVGLRTWLDRERSLLTADLRDRGLRPPRGVLLVGVPGCGKSLSAKAIAANWSLPLYRLDMAAIQGQYLGQSEGRLKEALATADHVAPCVLWIDEIEKGLGGVAGGGDGGTSARLLGQFLFWLQESRARVFVVATANDVSGLPAELLRRGRFDELFFVDLPTPAERREIVHLYARRNLHRTLVDPLLAELVELSEGFAGADLEAAVREVAKEAIRAGDHAVTEDTFRRCFANVMPLVKVNPERIDAIRSWGRERAVPASGAPIGGAMEVGKPGRRVVLV